MNFCCQVIRASKLSDKKVAELTGYEVHTVYNASTQFSWQAPLLERDGSVHHSSVAKRIIQALDVHPDFVLAWEREEHRARSMDHKPGRNWTHEAREVQGVPVFNHNPPQFKQLRDRRLSHALPIVTRAVRLGLLTAVEREQLQLSAKP